LSEWAVALERFASAIEGGFFCYPYFAQDPLLQDPHGEREHRKLTDPAKDRHQNFERHIFSELKNLRKPGVIRVPSLPIVVGFCGLV
jgi:hypothetical protein